MRLRREKGLNRWIGLLVCLFSVLLLCPLFLGALGAFPAADDFVYAVRTHAEWQRSGSLPHVVMDAIRYAAQIFRNWQGTFTGALVMALNPAVFSWRLYPWHAVALVLFSLGTFVLLLREVGRAWLRVGGLWYIPAGFALCALSWVLMPDLREGLYWFNSAWFYTATQFLLYLAVALALALGQAKGGLRYIGWPLLWGMMLWLGLNNYVTAVLACFLMALFALGFWRKGGMRRWGMLAAFLLLSGAVLVNVLAPGNAVRLATDTASGLAGLSLGETALTAIGQSFVLLGRYLFATPLWVFALMAGLLGLLHPHLPAWRLRTIACLPLLLWLLLVAMLFPHLYTSGYIGPARVVNLYQGYILLASLGYAYLLGGALRVLLAGMRIPRGAGLAGGAVLLSLALVLGGLLAFVLPGSYRTLLRELRSGDISVYRTDMLAQMEALERAAPGSDVVLPPVVRTPSIAFSLASEDAGNWNNEALAEVFGLGSVRTEASEAGKAP